MNQKSNPIGRMSVGDYEVLFFESEDGTKSTEIWDCDGELFFVMDACIDDEKILEAIVKGVELLRENSFNDGVREGKTLKANQIKDAMSIVFSPVINAINSIAIEQRNTREYGRR